MLNTVVIEGGRQGLAPSHDVGRTAHIGMRVRDIRAHCEQLARSSAFTA